MAGLSSALTHRMDYLVQRQGVVSGNLANATTPDYISQDIQFEKLVDNQMAGMSATNPKHFAIGTGTSGGYATTEDKTYMRHDGNSVKADVEMLKLQEIQIDHRMAAQLYKKHAGMLRMVLNSGSGGQ